MRRRRPADTRRGALGSRGEDLAARLYERDGYRVIARNWQGRGEARGEIDLVCRKDGVVAFVEVKTRTTDRFGGPLAAITTRKQARMRRLATAFLREEEVRAPQVRFDVVAIETRPGRPPDVRRIVGAF